MAIERILVPVDFTRSSAAALDYALSMADEHDAEVEVVYVWTPHGIFAETPEGIAMVEILTAAEDDHSARVSGRLEVGEEPARVILAILETERFDLVVMGLADDQGRVVADVSRTAPCAVVAIASAA